MFELEHLKAITYTKSAFKVKRKRDDNIETQKQERQDRIVLLLNRTGFMTSNSLAKQIGVTSMTIRRDINELDQAHKVIKTYGGAKPLSNDMTVEFSTSQKINN